MFAFCHTLQDDEDDVKRRFLLTLLDTRTPSVKHRATGTCQNPCLHSSRSKEYVGDLGDLIAFPDPRKLASWLMVG
jgi:hypothetical protein